MGLISVLNVFLHFLQTDKVIVCCDSLCLWYPPQNFKLALLGFFLFNHREKGEQNEIRMHVPLSRDGTKPRRSTLRNLTNHLKKILYIVADVFWQNCCGATRRLLGIRYSPPTRKRGSTQPCSWCRCPTVRSTLSSTPCSPSTSKVVSQACHFVCPQSVSAQTYFVRTPPFWAGLFSPPLGPWS